MRRTFGIRAHLAQIMVALAMLAMACALLTLPVSSYAANEPEPNEPASNEPAGNLEPDDATRPDLAMYRMYNPNSGEHFYTSSVDERDTLVIAGWHDEGAGWMAPATSNTPVYRLYSGTDHHYTTDADERDMLIGVGWSYEGIGWYSDDAKRVALLRQFNPNVDPNLWRNNSGSHNFTADQAENNMLVQAGWRAEGIGWYGTDHALYAGSYGVVEPDGDIWISTSPYYEVHVASQVGDDITMDIVSSARNGNPLCIAGCTATVVDGKASFQYTDNHGNSGEGTLTFGNGELTVDIRETVTKDASATLARNQVLPLTARSVIRSRIQRTPEQMRARMNISEDYRAVFDHGYKGGYYQRYIVLHDTEGGSYAQWIIDGWESNGRRVAAHFVVNRDGSIVQCVPMDRIAHHAGWGNIGRNALYGVDEWRDDKAGTWSTVADLPDYGMNSWSIGIEMVHEGEWTPYPEAQLVAVDQLIAYIDSYYGFHSTIIDHKDWRIGNSDTSPAFAGYLRNYKDHRTHY